MRPIQAVQGEIAGRNSSSACAPMDSPSVAPSGRTSAHLGSSAITSPLSAPSISATRSPTEAMWFSPPTSTSPARIAATRPK